MRRFLCSPTTVIMVATALLPRSSRMCVVSSRLMTFCASSSRACKITKREMDGTGRGPHQQPSHFVVTLERAVVGTKVDTNCDEELWRSGVFDAEVHPHVPPARTLRALLVNYMRRAKVAALGAWQRNGQVASTCTAEDPKPAESGYLVRSVPMQTCRKEGIRRRLTNAAGVDSEGLQLNGTRPADALLIMSGSHPFRRLPLANHAFLDVYDGLKLASSMRDRGLLPKGLAIWTVANPLTEADETGVERLRRKVELGAEVILTQPPLVWEPFERWLRGIHASRALEGIRDGAQAKNEKAVSATIRDREPSRGKRAKIFVGMPVITSPSGLGFWLELCGVDKCDRICKDAFAALEKTKIVTPVNHAECKYTGSSTSTEVDISSGVRTTHGNIKDEVFPYGRAWFETTLLKLQGLDRLGVAGVHVMAPGPGPRRRAKELLDSGVFDMRRR